MPEHGNNATAPGPAIAPGVEHIDPAAVARACPARDSLARIREVVPAFDAPFFQAGLAGYSDAAMRIIARRHGCPFCVTEALLDQTLLAGGRGFTKADLGDLHENVPGGPEDHPLACQIMGSDPREMAAAALKVAEQMGSRRTDKFYRKLAYSHLSAEELADRFAIHLRLPGGEQLGRVGAPSASDHATADPLLDSCETLVDEINSVGSPSQREGAGRRVTTSVPANPAASFETIDVNLACPVKKIRARARGGHWLAEPDGAVRILEAVRAAVPAHIPCTVKLRRSYDDSPEMVENFERIFDAAFAMGYAWATVHARTVEQKYIGPSRWGFLRDLVDRNPGKLVFGSGDVWNVEDIFRMIGYTGVAAVAVARGCIGNPWVFRQAREMMDGRPPAAPTIGEQRAVLEEHFRIAASINGEEHASKAMRKFGIRFAAHHPRGDEVRRRFIATESLSDWRSVLDEFYQPA